MTNFDSLVADVPSESDKVGEITGNNTYHPGTVDTDEYDELHVQCPPHTTERKLMTRIDWRLIPFLCILYLLAFLDRVNIANARSFHLVEDLNLKNNEYNTGMWYKRNESQKRYSLFFSSTSLAGAFGGLLASAIGKMQVAIIFFFIFPSFPEEAKWLTEEERAYVKARLQADQGRNAAERKITFRDVINVMKDHRVWLGGFMYFGLIVPAYGYAFFAPSIISTYHFDAIQTQLRSVPPWAASFVFSILTAVLSDWMRHRAAFALLPLCLGLAAFATLLRVHDNTPVQYGMLHLVTMATYSVLPITVCWFSMNLGGHHRRAIGTAWQIGFGNIGGIIATFAFLSTDAPYYRNGYSICLGFTCLSGLASALYLVSIYLENQKRKRAVRDVGLSDYEKTELGDLNPEFRYMY
ncbi:hypothetical protein Hte_011640 [Hypoxylon texense]